MPQSMVNDIQFDSSDGMTEEMKRELANHLRSLADVIDDDSSVKILGRVTIQTYVTRHGEGFRARHSPSGRKDCAYSFRVEFDSNKWNEHGEEE